MSCFTIARPIALAAWLAVFATPVALRAQAPEEAQEPFDQQAPSRAEMAAQLDSNFKAADSNGDKTLSLAEIEAAQKVQVAQAKASIDKRLDAEFARLDTNKDGQLSAAEFKAGAPGPRVVPANQLLAQIDRNRDGRISAEEHRAVPLANFDRIDTNKDGKLSAEEQAAGRRRR